MKLIHLQSPITREAFCNEAQINDILTAEPPPYNREVPALCKMCRKLHNQYLYDQQEKAIQVWNNRPPRRKLHDWLEGVAHWGESDMAALLDLMLLFATLGMIIPAKHFAKLLLKAGV